MKRLWVFMLLAELALGQQQTDLLKDLKFRLIGPFRGGRSIAAAGVPSDPKTFYFGGVGGGVWKTTDAGRSWKPVSDGQFKTSSVGAIAVAESDPNTVYAGMGEACVRGNASNGDGVYSNTLAATITYCCKYPDLDAFTPTGGFPQFLPDAYKAVASKYKDKIASGKLALVVADTLSLQIDDLRAGLSSGQVGQHPFEMGYKVMYALYDMKQGKPAPKDPTYTGLDICTPKNIDTCIAK